MEFSSYGNSKWFNDQIHVKQHIYGFFFGYKITSFKLTVQYCTVNKIYYITMVQYDTKSLTDNFLNILHILLSPHCNLSLIDCYNLKAVRQVFREPMLFQDIFILLMGITKSILVEVI